MESPASVRHQYIWSSISFLIRFLIPQFLGICALVYLVTEAPQLLPLWGLGDPSASVPDEEQLSPLYAMPWFLGQLLPAGLIGLTTAALLAAFMSTHDSYLLSWSSVLTQDVVAPLRRRPLSSAGRVRLTRIFIVLVGLYIWVWGLWYEGTDAVWNYMAITGAIYFTGAVPLLVGGLYWRRASSTGAVCALVCGCSAVFGLEPLRLWVGEHVLWLAGVAEPRESAERLEQQHRASRTAM